jgi:hypothetical protein
MELQAPRPGAEAARARLSGAAELLGLTLRRCADEQVTGAIQVGGEPGGLVHLVDGLTVAVETPGAPGVEVQLLRSGRLTEPDWSGAIGAIAGDPAGAIRLGPELISRGLVSAAEMEQLAVAAVFDGAFAIATGQVIDCRLVSTDPFWLPAVPGITADRLWREIDRRRLVLAGRREPVAHDRDRIVPVSWLDRDAVTLSPEQWNLLSHADGRRTPRDLAFVLGRGVYAITLEIARLLDAGLVQVASRREVPLLQPLPSGGQPPSRRVPAAGDAGYADPAYPAEADGAEPQDESAESPRRRPGISGAPANSTPGIAGRWAARLPHAWASWSSNE